MSAALVTRTAMTDISANLFAAFMIVFIAIISQQPAQPSQTQTLDIDSIDAMTAPPLDASGMINHLHLRAADTSRTAIDIHDGDLLLDVASMGLHVDLPMPLTPQNRSLLQDVLARPGPVLLYVFANGAYAPLRGLLQDTHVSWHELDIPDALRRPDGRDWSADFQNLLARHLNEKDFRVALSELLQGTGRTPHAGAGAGRMEPDATTSTPRAPAAKTLFISLLWLGLVLAIERWIAAPRNRPDKGPDPTLFKHRTD